MVHDSAASRFPDTYQNFFPQNDYGYVEEQSHDDVILEEPNPEAKFFFKMLSAANNPLYDGCEITRRCRLSGK